MPSSTSADGFVYRPHWIAFVHAEGTRLTPVRIARSYIEEVWAISYSEDEIRKALHERVAEIATLAARAHAEGLRHVYLQVAMPHAL
jgi:hypothetical protein